MLLFEDLLTIKDNLMGCDIHGLVETRPYDWAPNYWVPVLHFTNLVGRNYGMFGLLFGVRNYDNYTPIAEDRGLPLHASDMVQQESESVDYHSHSYVYWGEIAQIRWDTEVDEFDSRVHVFKKNESGILVDTGTKFEWASGMDEAMVMRLNTGEKVQVNDGAWWGLARSTYRDALDSGWEFVFSLMKQMDEHLRASSHDREDNVVESRPLPVTMTPEEFIAQERVRLVAWFDN